MKNGKTLCILASTLFLMIQTAGAIDVDVSVGDNIQEAVDRVAAAGGGMVNLGAGIHQISTSIKMKSNVTLSGAGHSETTINTSKVIKSIEQASEGLRNVTIQNLTITGVVVNGSHAIHLVSYRTDHRHIKLLNVHASRTGWGVHIKGAQDVIIRNCEFTKNGAKGKEGYAHNLYLRRCKNALVSHTKLIGSTTGNGCNISYSKNITLDRCEVLNNYFRGIRAADTDGYTVTNCRIGGNGKVGLLANREKVVTQNINFVNNIVFDNGEGGIQAGRGVTGSVTHCVSYGNKRFDFSLPTTVKQSANSSECPAAPEEILTTLVQTHSRLMLKDDALRDLKKRAENDEVLRRFVREVIRRADGHLDDPHLHKKDGPRLLSVSRACVERVYTLGLAWRWTGQKKYADKIKENLLTVCAFPDWNPSHFLDTAEMSHAVGVGYDWIHNDLDQETRNHICLALVELGLKPGIERYKSGYHQF